MRAMEVCCPGSLFFYLSLKIPQFLLIKAKSLHCRHTGMHDADLAGQLTNNGVKQISVILPAADPKSFENIVQPPSGYGFGTVCSFIAIAAEQGCLVECTTVAREGVDARAVRELAMSLGAVDFRVRSYHE